MASAGGSSQSHHVNVDSAPGDPIGENDYAILNVLWNYVFSRYIHCHIYFSASIYTRRIGVSLFFEDAVSPCRRIRIGVSVSRIGAT